MMRRMGMMIAAGALAACGTADADDARPAAPSAAVADSAPVPRTEAAPAPDSGAGKEIRVHPTLPPHAFALHEREPGVVDSIVVTARGRRVQTLRPGENHVVPHAQADRLSAIDLDFDGYADLALLSTVAMANSRSEYWRFDPRARRFVAAGERETLTPDSAAREHTTFTRGGHGGRMWTAARWRWADTALLPVAEEEQTTLDAERYVHIVRRARDEGMTETRRDTLEDAGLRAGPSWMEP